MSHIHNTLMQPLPFKRQRLRRCLFFVISSVIADLPRTSFTCGCAQYKQSTSDPQSQQKILI